MSAVKTIGLWVLLIILFVAFYQVYSVPPGEGGTPPSPSADWLTIFVRWLPLVFVVLFFLYYWRATRRYASTHEGVRMLSQGRYVQAMQLFEKYRKDQPKQPVGAFNLGSTRLQLWKLESALPELEAAKKLANGKVPLLEALIPEHLALTHALLGREGDARRELSEVPADKGDPGRMSLVEAILAARGGDASTARQKLSTFEVKQMSGTVGALSRTLDAWCIELLTGERRHVDRVAIFGETGPDELRKHWPEFIAFVERAPAW